MTEIDGRWHLEFPSPTGTKTGILDVKTDGTHATGTMLGDHGNSAEIIGSVEGSNLHYEVDVTEPIPMKVAFTLRFEGEAVTGTIKPGDLPAADVSGVRLTNA